MAKKIITATDYIAISSFFYRMKIIHGNDFVNTTLRNHPDTALRV